MSDAFRHRPAAGEFNDFYAGYISHVPDGSVLETLKEQHVVFARVFNSITADRVDHAYAEGKWTVRQVLAHINDTERIFAYRALCFARGDAGPLPGMDQDAYVSGAHVETRTFAGLVDEFVNIRASTISLVKGMTANDLMRQGVASGFGFSVRALCWIMAGHAQHHVSILQERYLQ